MAETRSRKLTWQKRPDGKGRWKKVYRGKPYYFEGGNGKSDYVAYRAALEAWQRLKLTLDVEAEVSKPHRGAYEDAIRQWEGVYAWAKEQEDEAVMAAAATRLADLRARLALPKPGPLNPFDRPARKDHLTWAPLLDWMAQDLGPDVGQVSDAEAEAFCEHIGVDVQDLQAHRLRGVLAHVVKTAVWRDRLKTQRRKQDGVPHELTVASQVEAYVTVRGRSGITAGAVENIRRHLNRFSDFVEPTTEVEALTAKSLDDFHGHLVGLVDQRELTAVSARNLLQTVRGWLRWAWERQLLPELPRNLNTPAHRIRPELKAVKPVSLEDLKRLYAAATEPLRLYMLLALNTGMTQVDVADMRPEQVDFKAGTLTRRRGKTKGFGSVPTVVYPLWPESLRLLKELRSTSQERLLVAPQGGPLKHESHRDGRLAKHDFIGQAFGRLAHRIGAKASFKGLKKTSATLLRGHPSYNGLEALFLDHAARSTADKHYAAVPTALFAEAVNWLRGQFPFLTGADRGGKASTALGRRPKRLGAGR